MSALSVFTGQNIGAGKPGRVGDAEKAEDGMVCGGVIDVLFERI